MAIAIIARRNLDAYIPDTEIVVKIPEGTTGHIIHENRGNVVTVQFDVPSLGLLRVNRDDLTLEDSLEAIVDDMRRLLNSKGVEKTVHRNADELLLRAIQILAEGQEDETANKLIELFKQIPKHYI